MNDDDKILDLSVDFGGVSIGASTARLGLTLARDEIDLDTADECFCAHRLDCTVVLGSRRDAGGQQLLIDDVDIRLSGHADVKRFGVSPDTISLGLTFSLADIDVAELAKFSKGSGRLIVSDVRAILDDDTDSSGPSEPPGALAAPDRKGTGRLIKWREYPLAKLFDGAILKALEQAGLKTVGDLAEYTTDQQSLTDVEGIGPAKAEQIENRLMEFWEDNPDDGS